MKTIFKFLIKSMLAGIMIGIGGTVFLSCENKVVGAFLFAIGLFVIVSSGLNLYTGKIGYLVNNKASYLIELIITLAGNFIGTNLVGLLLKFTRIYDSISLKAQSMCDVKLDDSIVSIFILSIFCGILMYLAVNGYKTIKDILGKNLIVFLGVAVFILCGFEHCIANMFYFSASDMYTWESLIYISTMILGNSIGAIIFALSDKYIKKDTELK